MSVKKNYYNFISSASAVFFVILLKFVFQILVLVPGKHAFFFGIIGGFTFGWINSSYSGKNALYKLNYATISAGFSLIGAIIGSMLSFKFAPSFTLGLTWTVLEWNLKYNKKIISFDNDEVNLSTKAIFFILIGSIPLIGYVTQDILQRISTIKFRNNTLQTQEKNIKI